MTEPETTCKGFEVNHLVKQYANADKPVLDDISFKVEHGSVLVVLGPSGSGKSTLLRTIAGLEPIQGGTISINDQVIDAGKPGTERAGRSDRSSELRTRIGMVFQSYVLFPNKRCSATSPWRRCSCRNAISPRWRLKRSGCLAAWTCRSQGLLAARIVRRSAPACGHLSCADSAPGSTAAR